MIATPILLDFHIAVWAWASNLRNVIFIGLSIPIRECKSPGLGFCTSPAFVPVRPAFDARFEIAHLASENVPISFVELPTLTAWFPTPVEVFSSIGVAR